MRKIQSQDYVVVLAGKDKGKTGVVKRILRNKKSKNSSDLKVIVSDVNLVVKHEKPNPNKGIKGGRVKKEKSVDISNVAIFNRATNKKDKVKIVVEEGKKFRVYSSTGEKIEKELN